MLDVSISSIISLTLAALILLRLLVQLTLVGRQARHVWQHRSTVPPAFASAVTQTAHQRAADYTMARGRLAVAAAALEAAVLLGWTLLGGLDALNGSIRSLIHDAAPTPTSALVYQIVLVAAVMLIGGLVELPLDILSHFRVEKQFGFNRMSARQYVADTLKSTALMLVVALPLVALVLVFMREAGSAWWLWAFVALAVFQLTAAVVYPTWIAPLFNRFTPLADPALEARVRALMQRCGFKAQGLLVMDGSKRSAHANAYFTGLGRSKRVVFYDTLLQALKPEEVEAVLAHELGHFHHRHILQRLGLALALELALLAALGWLSSHGSFYQGLGVEPNLQAPNDALALLLFTLALPTVTFFWGPVSAAWSRRQEFEADAYAARQSDAAALASALITLYKDNASTLTPDPWYARFHYSHPPALERISALRALGQPA